jgi:hypothetical protein
MAKLLGSSPLGLAFFSDTKNPSFVKPHDSFTRSDLDSRTREINNKDGIKLDYGIEYTTYGDKKSIFTSNDKMPRTFYAYYDNTPEKTDENSTTGPPELSTSDFFPSRDNLLKFIKSSPENYYNSDYTNQYSSISSIIDKINDMIKDKASKSLKLSYADFAYLSNLGVYPSNRMVIARRFPSGVGDDLLLYKDEPISVIPSWIEDGKPFVDITYSEQWTDVTDVNLANPIGELGDEYKALVGNFLPIGDDGKTIKVSEYLNKAAGAVPIPGFTEYTQYAMFNKLGLTDASNLLLLPQGNPNIIRKAITRSTYTKDSASSGLNYNYSITITNEYEIKYIDGVDPTLVYFDIISNLLSFGTSEAQFQFDGRFSKKAKDLIDNLASGKISDIFKTLVDFLAGLVKVGTSALNFIGDVVVDTLKGQQGGIVDVLLGSQIKKYRIKFIGIINALSGSPSGIYHVTIGNPLRPLFSSGDLYPGKGSETTKITLGTELGYNNLPTTIKFSTTLTNARPCGLQEIFKKFSPSPVREVLSDPFSYDPKSITGPRDRNNRR